MTGEQLKEALTRIAEDAPAVEVPRDVFARGRRATVRARLLIGAAAAACVGLLAAVGAPLVTAQDADVADQQDPVGVPDHIYSPDLGERSIEFTTTPLDEVGPAAAAYQVEGYGNPLMVITDDGAYRAVTLPDQWEPGLDDVGAILSPDGRQLAYASQRELVRGMSVVDLTTGSVRDIALAPGPGALISSLQWSPDGRWIAWSGQPVKEARENGASYRGRSIAGLVPPESTRSRAIPDFSGDSSRGPGICNDGTPLPPGPLGSSGDLAAAHGRCTPPTSYFHHPGPGHYRLLGWLPGHQGDPGSVAVVQLEHRRLVLGWPEGARQRVGTIESAWTKNLSVATGLMSADRPTVPAGEDPWARPWVAEHWLELLAGLVAAALAILVAVRARAVRR